MSVAYAEHGTASGGQFIPGRDRSLPRLRQVLEDLTSANITASPWVKPLDSTSAAVVIDLPTVATTPPQVAALDDLKKHSGFTWDQLARLFGVDRRSIHNWTNGQPMTQAHEEALHRIHEIVHLIDDANPFVVRGTMRDRTRGSSIADLLAAHRFDDARVVALGGVVIDERAALRAPSRPLSPEERRKRSDGLTPFDLTQTVGKGELPRPGLRKSTPISRRRRHGDG